MLAQPKPGRVKEQLVRILASPGFKDSHRASLFLSYVVEQTLAGCQDEIKEVTIGVGVFGRDPSYNPRADAIVRSVARALREKLNDYYLTHGLNDSVRIELPKSVYIPVFREVTIDRPHARPNGFGTRIALASLLLVVLVFGGDRRQPRLRESGREIGALSPSELYSRGREMWTKGAYSAARPLLERAAILNPHHALAHAILSQDLGMLGYPALALEEARKAVTNEGDLAPTDQLEIEGTYRLAAGEYKAAVHIYEQLAELHPERAEYRREILRGLQGAAEYAQCLAAIGRMRHDVGVKADGDPQLNLIDGRCRAGTGDYESALVPVQRGVSLASLQGLREVYARGRLFEFGLLISTGRSAGSRPILEEARRICVELGVDSCVADAARIQGNLDLWSKPKSAIADYDAALLFARKLNSFGEVSQVLNGRAYAREMLSDFSGANADFLEALSNAKQASLGLAGIHLSMAELALAEGQITRATVLARQAGLEAQEGEDRDGQVQAQLVLADVLMLQGDLDGASRSLQNTSGLGLRSLPSATRALWASTSATLHRLCHDLDLAAKQMNEAESTVDASTEFPVAVARTELLLDQRDYAGARRSAERALASLANTERTSDTVRLQSLLSDSYGYERQLDRAREISESARSLLTSPIAPLVRIKALTSAGRWTDQASDRERCLNEAVNLARRNGFKLAEIEAQSLLLHPAVQYRAVVSSRWHHGTAGGVELLPSPSQRSEAAAAVSQPNVRPLR